MVNLWDRSGASASQPLGCEIDAMGVVNKAVKVSIGRAGSPMNACHLSTGIWLVDRRAALVTLLEDLVGVATGAGIERFEA
jgi:hypothetical protein